MLNGPHLTIAFLARLPAGTMLRDVQAHYACGRQWSAWTRWAQATPAEIVDDVRLQRHFAPVLTWRCAEIVSASPVHDLGRSHNRLAAPHGGKGQR